MSEAKSNSQSCIAINSISAQFTEDPHREPHEKETSLHVEGDGTQMEVRSFKRGVFEKLLHRPEFEVKSLYVLDDENREHVVDTVDEAVNQSLPIIGVVGKIPVGSINIGTPRNSNSHADIVK